MRRLCIRWKGRPYRHFPRIRLASTTRHSLRTRSQAAAEAVTLLPLSNELERERVKQKIKSKNRRSLQSSKGSSALISARKRVSRRARHHIQVFGWNTEIARKTSTDKLGHRHLSTTAVRGSRFKTVDGARSVIDSFDCSASSAIRNSGNSRRRHTSLLTLSVGTPVQYRPTANLSSRKTSATEVRASQAWSTFSSAYERTESTILATRRNTYDGAHNLKKSHPTLYRLESKVIQKCRPQAIYGSLQRQPSVSSRKPPTKTIAQSRQSRIATRGSRAFWDAVESIASKTGHTVAKKASLESIVQNFQAEPYLRTPSQKKKLKRFIRELELYVQAAKSLPKQSLAPSISSTTVSANTVEVLKPYHAEFQAAGLAVTSSEQQRMSTVSARTQSSAPATPPKDKKWATKKPAAEKSKMNRKMETKTEAQDLSQSTSSYTTGTDVIVFTPPHETSYPRPNRPLSDAFKLPALPVGLDAGSAVTGQPSSPRNSPKRSLPWLRAIGNSSPTNTQSVKRDTPESSERRRKSGRSSRPLSPLPIIPKRSTSRRRVDLRPPEEKVREAKRINDFSELKKHHVAYGETSGHRKPNSGTRNIVCHTKKFANASTQTNFADLMRDRLMSVESSIDENAVIDCYLSPASRRSGTGATRHSYEDYLYEIRSRTSKRSPNTSSITVQADRSRRGSVSLPSIAVSRNSEGSGFEELRGASPARQPPPLPKFKGEGSLSSTCHIQRQSPRNSEHELRNATATSPDRTQNGLHQDCVFDAFQCQQCIPGEDAKRSFTPSEPSQKIGRPRRREKSSSVKTDLEEACIRSDSGDVSRSSEQEFGNRLQPKLKAEPTLSVPVSPDQEHSRQKLQTVKRSPSSPLPPLPHPSSISSLPTTNGPSSPLALASVSASDISNPSAVVLAPPLPSPHTDIAILLGLKVATAAACDEEVDQWIEEVMGSGVRKFLADLGRFDGLGVNELAERARRTAGRRRERLSRGRELRSERDGKMDQWRGRMKGRWGDGAEDAVGNRPG